uniref:Integrin beta N-terminal domain-containing protein n=1 Tax=Anabas testudineus TaxID=64144 RepID=A0AAQ6IBL0_ANATE
MLLCPICLVGLQTACSVIQIPCCLQKEFLSLYVSYRKSCGECLAAGPHCAWCTEEVRRLRLFSKEIRLFGTMK